MMKSETTFHYHSSAEWGTNNVTSEGAKEVRPPTAAGIGYPWCKDTSSWSSAPTPGAAHDSGAAHDLVVWG